MLSQLYAKFNSWDTRTEQLVGWQTVPARQVPKQTIKQKNGKSGDEILPENGLQNQFLLKISSIAYKAGSG